MQNPPDPQHPHPPIAGRFLVDAQRPLPGAGGGLPAFRASDLRSGRADLMAVAVGRAEPVRADLLRDLIDPIDNLLTPLGHGNAPGPDGAPAYYVVCPAPPGPAVAEMPRPWAEAVLITHVLLPVAHVLRRLEMRGLTHRGIRPANVFAAAHAQPVVLGCAWAAPPALHQPPAYEPFYSLMCHKAARGNGTIADDIYALGCLLIALATGTDPLAGQDAATVLRRKLELGSFAALAGDQRLPPIIGDLARGMLAEDPDHRPTAAMLLDPAAARSRRVAARPPRRAPRPIVIGGSTAWDARGLAQTIGGNPEAGARALRDGSVSHWLRRAVGDALLCTRIDELVRHRSTDRQTDEALAETLLAMRVVAAIETLAPLCWQGIALWPDGLPTVLAWAQGRDSEILPALEELITAEAIGSWAAMREDRCDTTTLRAEARSAQGLFRLRAPAGGVARLAYALNPLLPCGGVLGQAHWVTALDTIAPAMEDVLRANGGEHPFDAAAIVFLAARAPRGLDIEVNALTAHTGSDFPAMPWVRILAHVQTRHAPWPLPALTRWIATQAEPLTNRWHNRERRTAAQERLRALADDGLFAPLLAALDDPAALEADTEGAHTAAEALARIDAELAHIANAGAERAALAARYGQEITAGLGLMALAMALVMAAFG